MKQILLIAILIGLGGCEKKVAPPKPPSKRSAFDSARQTVRNALKDPASASFQHERFGENRSTVCGEVNAKNGYGGYVGFLPYIYDTKSGHVDISPGEPDFQTFIADTHLGLQITDPILVEHRDKLSRACSFKQSWVNVCATSSEKANLPPELKLCPQIEEITRKADALPR